MSPAAIWQRGFFSSCKKVPDKAFLRCAFCDGMMTDIRTKDFRWGNKGEGRYVGCTDC